MKNYLIIHGHFYQPPREEPDTGVIPRQPSASPYKNWNEKITRECYAANAFSRVLGPDGRITEIINNYQYLSFNFGPTLFHWIREKAPKVYDRILEADRVSIERNNGHGNGIAQGYNHTILPLDSPVNLETQIAWGLEDFRFHFGRETEGIWLPETAVNERVLDSLIERGIKFIILSPWQAAGWRAADEKRWHEVNDQPISSDRVYFIKRPGGSISVFFYNHALASGISFNHFLHNADTLYEKLLSFADFKRKGHLINIATDGEIYGHHEPYGDMCVAALSKKILQKKEFVHTNYGFYLELFPPVAEVRLKKGEEERGTSWSCHHGVSRWYKDCGCSTGSREEWNQKWRTPLREAFTDLFEKTYALYEERMKTLSNTDPKKIRDRYVSVLTGAVPPSEFARTYLPPEKSEDDESRIQFLSLLEGQKYAMFMFTSCGWFFADISGLEPVQNIRYAYTAIQFYRSFSSEDLLTGLKDHLSRTRSNIDSLGTGKEIMQKRVIGRRRDIPFIAAVFTALLTIQDKKADHRFGNFICTEIKSRKDDELTVTFQRKYTEQRYQYSASITGRDDGTYTVTVNGGSLKKPEKIPGYKLPFFVRELLYRHLSTEAAALCRQLEKETLDLLEHNFATSRSLKVPASELMRAAAEAFLLSRLNTITTGDGGIKFAELNPFIRALTLLHQHNVQFERQEVKKSVSLILSRWIEKIIETPAEEDIKTCLYLLEGLRQGDIEPDLTVPQNFLYGYLRTMSFTLAKDQEAGSPDRETLKLLPMIARLGNQIGLDADRMIDQFTSRQEKS